MTMTILDFVIILIGAISILVGLMRGFVREVLSIITWVAAIWLSLKFYPMAGDYFKGIINQELFRNVAGFAAIFFTVLIICSLVSYLINKLVTKTGIKGTDRVLGSIFGIFRAILVIVILLLIGRSVNFQESDAWKNSQLVGHFEPIVEIVNNFLPEDLKIDSISSIVGELSGSQSPNNDKSDPNSSNEKLDVGKMIEKNRELLNQPSNKQ